ncbi:MAG TPA: hypothetical protein VI072_18080 [Polyangiaceae bacterium]
MLSRLLSQIFAISALSGAVLGCQVGCIEDGSGTTCSAKSLERFDGAPPPVQVFDRVPGAPVTIDVMYGNAVVQRSTSGKIEVQFAPFVYAGYGERARADQQLSQNLRATATTGTGVVATVRREGGSNGLGANVLVRLPDDFDGPIKIVNRGNGPLNHFDVKVEFVARASAITVTNDSQLGSCWIQGAPSVRNTTVQCGEDISVFDVSDQVSIENVEKRHDEDTPAVTLRLARVSPGSPGGRISSASGAIAATFPSAGGYVIDAKVPVKGVVQEGTLPQSCVKEEAGPAQKTIRCGQGPTYELTAGAAPDYIGQPSDSNVTLEYR